MHNKLSPEEKGQLEQWYASFDEKEKDIIVFKNVAHEKLVQTRLLNRIRKQLPYKNDTLEANNTSVVPLWSRFSNRYLTVAAAFLLLMFSASLFFYLKSSSQPEHTIVRTSVGEISRIALSDGSQVWLNANSELKYPEHFTSNTRELYLEGEAFFDVSRDTTKPFVVHAANLKTKVLGTAFNIRSHKNSSLMRVSVTRGKVAVSEGPQQVMLVASEEATYNKQTKSLIKSRFDAQMTDWWLEKGSYQFRDEALADVAIVLGNKFGKHITISNPALAAKRITASFKNSEPLQDVTETLKIIIGLQSKQVRAEELEWY
ncbi:FecR family protein [Pontibacter silvestris]|uniref:FecR family protein n=1 Tax=Pontibacter silvestris TaxID=2305183 RepID=A0ABW4WVC8_9BACT|nr:FecR domain-containing protein [Pontibacter silvestris]MCC9138590.1 FecR domain-containing protein [Pontibacter silvestris]